MRKRDLFPADRSLMVRMVAVSIATPLLVVALLVAVFLALPSSLIIGVLIVIGAGTYATISNMRRTDRRVVLREQDAPELFATVDRLCAIADVPRPEIVLEHERQPNSWIIAPPGRRPQLHVTQALLDLLERNELQAVLAHELSHIANRDATVMTVVGMPGTILLAGAAGTRGPRGFWIGGLWIMACRWLARLIGRYAQLGTNTLSRYRELAADQGAAAITGHPSALASALIKVSGQLAKLPSTDLRVAAARDGFHLVAVGELRTGGPPHRLFDRLNATHPSLEQRLKALEALETSAQHARPTLTQTEG